MALIKNCKECGKEFKTYPSKIKIGRGKYCSKKCSNKNTLIKPGQHISLKTEIKKGQRLRYNGYRFTQSRPSSQKYKLIHKPNHPNCTKSGYVREHRLVAEKYLGRYLNNDEIVHHIDENGLNNEISNLEVMLKIDHDKLKDNLSCREESKCLKE